MKPIKAKGAVRDPAGEGSREADRPLADRASSGKFEVHAHPMGLKPGLSYDRIAELLEQIEGPSHR
ncbi:MAG: hypothetical protein ACYDCL_12700 [Myxococcales bacterium]